MTLHFHLPYVCAEGENLCASLFTLPDQQFHHLPLTTTDGSNHTASIVLENISEVRYRYEVVDQSGEILRTETTAPRCIKEIAPSETLVCCDHWGEDIPEPALLRGAFATAAFRVSLHERTVAAFTFRLMAPEPPKGYRWAVSGEALTLGQWDIHRAVPLMPGVK